MSVLFDGTDDYIPFGTTGISSAGNRTISLWFKADDVTLTGLLIDFDTNITDQFNIGIYQSKLNACVAQNQIGANSSSVISSGVWYHLVITKIASDIQNIYINGVDDTQGPHVNFGSTTTGTLWVGAQNVGGGTFFFKGQITDVAIWSTQLTLVEAQNIYNSKIKGFVRQVQSSSLIFYSPLDDQPSGTSGDGDTFFDQSGSANNGTGVDGANNTGLTMAAEEVLSYDLNCIYVDAQGAAAAATQVYQPTMMLMGFGM